MKKNPILRIYNAAAPVFGKHEAREYIATAISLLIYDLEKAGKLTDENLENALLEEADWTEKAAAKALKEKKGQDVA